MELEAVVDDADGVGGTTVACDDTVDACDNVACDDCGATAAAATFAYPDGGFRGGAGVLTMLATDCCAKFACGGGLEASSEG